MARTRPMLIATLAGAAFVMAGCDNASLPFTGGKDQDEEAARSSAEAGGGDSVTLVERDVEAPEVFQMTETGLWDGRPSLGGVWVAHPDVDDPERVIIRNPGKDTFVIGALFSREREQPGPPLQVSSDAAAALEMVAGQPTKLDVTALRREEVEDPDESDEASAQDISTETLDDGGGDGQSTEDAAAGAADSAGAAQVTQQDEAGREESAPPSAGTNLERPFIQIGIFSVEENAKGTGERLREEGMVPNINEETSRGKTIWRVTVGPARTSEERDALLNTARDMGFEDAYFVDG